MENWSISNGTLITNIRNLTYIRPIFLLNTSGKLNSQSNIYIKCGFYINTLNLTIERNNLTITYDACKMIPARG
jgi:hypothetical protein